MKHRYVVVFEFSGRKGNIEITRKGKIKTFEDFRAITDMLKIRVGAEELVITNVMRLPL
jgi:hypothetical protein